MIEPTNIRPKPNRAVIFLLITCSAVLLLQQSFYTMQAPELDARRYADYALNIYDHRVFGLSHTERTRAPAPGNANSPLYPAFVATALALDPGSADTLRCELSKKKNISSAAKDVPCPNDYSVIVLFQLTLVVASAFIIWCLTLRLFRNYLIAGLAVGCVLLSTKPVFFANTLLTENLILFLFALLMYSLYRAFIVKSSLSWAIVALNVACLALTRPEYLYLGYVFTLCGFGVVLIARSRHSVQCFAAFAVTFMLVLTPWLARNQLHFQKASLTGGYADAIVAYRASYNYMSFAEWRAAFIYWLPGYGETIAQKILTPSSYAKLGTDPQSYLYKKGDEIFERGLIAVGNDRERLTGYLIRTEILERPFHHAWASVPLIWRGILTGKFLALLGIPCLILLLWHSYRHHCYELLVLTFPALVMVCLYGAISVSVPRYDIFLIYYYAIASAWMIDRIMRAKHHKATAHDG